MAESLEELALPAEGGEDQLLMPPANPAAPPQAVSDAISTIVRNSETPSHSILNKLGRAGQHTLDWIKTPGQMMEGFKPETPGRWTEDDEFRAGQHANRPYEWGAQTALGMVFDPVPALAARLAAPTGSYALRNMRMTPVEGDPFIGGAAPEVALGVFAGPTAKTANMAKLKKAEGLEKAGQSEEQIWKETGWFRGADKKWRFEIDDRNAKFNRGEHKQVRPMGEVLEHPELYEAYPNLKDIKTETFSASGQGYHQPTNPAAPKQEKIRVPTGNTVFDPADPVKWPTLAKREREKGALESQHSSRNVALHELQHAIQSREGFASGGDPKVLLPLAIEEVKKNPALYGKQNDIAYEKYQRLAGEVEARNVTARSRGSDHPPWLTEDRPREKQTVSGVNNWTWPNKLVPVDHDPFK